MAREPPFLISRLSSESANADNICLKRARSIESSKTDFGILPRHSIVIGGVTGRHSSPDMNDVCTHHSRRYDSWPYVVVRGDNRQCPLPLARQMNGVGHEHRVYQLLLPDSSEQCFRRDGTAWFRTFPVVDEVCHRCKGTRGGYAPVLHGVIAGEPPCRRPLSVSAVYQLLRKDLEGMCKVSRDAQQLRGCPKKLIHS